MEDLPKNVCIEDASDYTYAMEDFINDYLSDNYGYLVKGYNYKINIEVTDIEWEIDEEEEQ